MDAAVDSAADASAGQPAHQPTRTWWLTVGAIGVVFGDIGTSPLYALRESFAGHHPLGVDRPHIFGVISIVFWTMILVVTIKYVVIMMRADNEGEGGSLSLLALISRGVGKKRWSASLTMLGIFATSLFFGDAMITPAVSVLSAVEGLEVIDPGFAEFVLPIAAAILILLFAIQRRGTESVGAVFGPLMLFYFACVTVLGGISLAGNPEVVQALSPHWGVRFFLAEPELAFLALGSIVLAVTGAEALYADMGHFGRQPIRIGWLAVVFPALMINYLGQGALLLRDPGAVESPFYLLAPAAFRMPLVILATVATVIASQAVITGAFSVTRQAVQLGLVPRLRVHHTSAREQGQIYVPLINWALLVAVLLLIFAFRSSSALAAAYGIAVTGTMFITTVMLGVLASAIWKWPTPVVIALVGIFALVDGAYFASNLTKLFAGGWFPLMIGVAAFTLLTTWAAGRRLVYAKLDEAAMPMKVFVGSVSGSVHRVSGTAVYLSASGDGVPSSLLHNLKHNQVLHERVLILTVRTQNVPVVAEADRASVEELGSGIARVLVRYGFIEDPDVPQTLAALDGGTGALIKQSARVSYFISRQTVLPSEKPGMARWREHLFAWMLRNSETAMDFFKLPPNRVVELGSHVEI